MGALLYKDLVLTWKNCRMVMLAALIFAVVAGMRSESLFFAVYAPIVMTATTLTTLAYDERSGWLRYADGLPYGRNTIVKSKYVMAFLCCVTAVLVTAVAGIVSGLVQGRLIWESMLFLAAEQFLVGTLQTVILLPVSLRMGVEKGRIVYMVCIVAFCALSFAVQKEGSPAATANLPLLPVCLVLAAVCLALWVLSYLIGAAVYRKRDLS